jgi:hypothetical protein
MPSKAAVEFGRARISAGLLIAAASAYPGTNTNPAGHKAACLHAALAMLVAAWEAYLERLVRDVQHEIADTTQVRLSAVLSLLTLITEYEVKRFNTPNATNSRELLVTHTGYDPINDWQWPRGGLSGVQARVRLDEILRIRHSFAHGFPVPTDIHWVRNRNCPGILNASALKSVDRFLAHLIVVTDRGVKSHLSLTYGVTPHW